MNTRLRHALQLACLAACLSSPLTGHTTVTTDAQDNTLWQDADESFRIEWAADGTLNRSTGWPRCISCRSCRRMWWSLLRR